MSLTRGSWRAALTLLLLSGSSLQARAAEQDAVDANRLKAAYLFNFTQFIEWPDQAFASHEAPFLICVAGPDKSGSLSAALAPLERRTYKGRAIVIQRPGNAAEARKCQIVYVTDVRVALADGKALVPQLVDLPILAVSEVRDMATNGAGIGFIEQHGKLRLVIDLGVLRPNRLKPSAKLLEIALYVNGG